MHRIYVISLSEGKYYVGMTTDLEKRLAVHASKREKDRPRWCRPHVFQGLHWVSEDEFEDTERALWEEDFVTVNFIERFGISNVRGGSFIEKDDAVVRHKLDLWYRNRMRKYQPKPLEERGER